MYSQDRQEEEQIAAYQTAYHEGYLEKSSEFVMMAQLYLSKEAPYEAAKLLQKAVDDGKVDTDDEKNWMVLAQAWFLSKYDEISESYLEIFENTFVANLRLVDNLTSPSLSISSRTDL